MAIIDSNQTVSANRSGFEKGIQRSASTMILDNLQTYMYQKPIQSAVRECVSNAVDSVKEKIMARLILTGKAKVNDYYIDKQSVADKIASKDDDIYEDSEFNKDYYDLAWLDSNDAVTLIYKTNAATLRDQFIIRDPGVGLGLSRLEGFFSLGYSSKRLNTNELGGFGLGAKSPLSTGVESYRIVSRYNGAEFIFDIYSHKVDCVYGKWNEDGTLNPYYEFKSVQVDEEVEEEYEEDGETKTRLVKIKVPYKAYYKPTSEKNGVDVILEVKKHNRQQYIEAVKSQLMYLKDDIQFYEELQNGQRQPINFKAGILYEDDDIIISDYNYYTRPHFVIKNVGYGIIDFAELDLSPKQGNIGIKVRMEDINVTPSRETVIYSNKTRDAVLIKYKQVSKTIERKIQESLAQDDFILWTRACNKIMYGNSYSNDITTRLSNLIDKSELRPKYGDSEYKYSADAKQFMTPLFHLTYNQIINNYNYPKQKQVKKLTKSESDSTISFDKPTYLQVTAGNGRVSSYLAATNTTGFVVVRVAPAYRYLEETLAIFVNDKIDEDEFRSQVDHLIKEHEKDPKRASILAGHIDQALQFVTYLKDSPSVAIYGEDLVPESFKFNAEDGDDAEIEVDVEAAQEVARKTQYEDTLKRRKENKAFVANIMANRKKSTYSYEASFEREEVQSADLDFDNTKIIWGTDDDTPLFKLLMYVEKSSRRGNINDSFRYYWDDKIKALKVAKNNVKYVKRGIHIKDYIIYCQDGTLFTCPSIKDLFTAAALDELLGEKCQYLENFEEFSPELAKSYANIRQFIEAQGRISTLEELNDNIVVKTLLAAYQVQKELLDHSSFNEEDKQNLIDKTIPQDLDLDIEDVYVINSKLYNEAKKLIAFNDVYGSILSYIGPLKDDDKPILQPDLVMELRSIINSRVDQLEYQYENIN